MKESLQQLVVKIDALSLRERAMMFVIAALALVTMVDTFVLAPLSNIQKQRTQQIKFDQQQIAAMQAEIRAIASGHNIDPDAANKSRLSALKQQSEKLRADLGSIQQSLVTPDRMGALLEDLLKKNKNLQLVSLKTQPVALLSDTRQAGKAPGEKQAAPTVGAKLEQQKAESTATGELVYKHGVELVVQGRYADIATYLSQLESMPWRLFWANASLEVAQHPNVTLTLTLFTISLDRTWLNI